MGTLWERAAHSLNHVLSLLCLFIALVVSHFGFEGRTMALIASFPGHCLPFTFWILIYRKGKMTHKSLTNLSHSYR